MQLQWTPSFKSQIYIFYICYTLGFCCSRHRPAKSHGFVLGRHCFETNLLVSLLMMIPQKLDFDASIWLHHRSLTSGAVGLPCSPPAPDVRLLWRNQIDASKSASGAPHHSSTLWFWSQVAWSRSFLIFNLSLPFATALCYYVLEAYL